MAVAYHKTCGIATANQSDIPNKPEVVRLFLPIYLRNGDYLFPSLLLEVEEQPIGKYGLLRKSYLKEHKRGWYSSLLLTGKLDKHLAEIDHSCNERIELIMNQLVMNQLVMNQLAQRESVTEALKATDQMTWVARMNSIRASAEEIVLSELVYR